MLRQKKTGQSSLEYAIILIIVMGALVGIQNYMKRGLQGRWKSALDGMGEQYDPRTADTNIRHQITSSTNTKIKAKPMTGGYWTKRTDKSASRETKTGYTAIGPY